MLASHYKFGWDDQHLEIPLLKSLINPALYQGDYYVESLKKNFVSFFYTILSRLITVDQIPTTYFILYCISRYFLFYWIYKLWLLIAENRFKAFVCVLVFILVARVDEFLYRTFSHQEFALAIIFGGIYYFFKERFFLAAIFLGIAANFHALYSLFPMIFMGSYLLWQVRKHGWMLLFKTCGLFILTSLPFLIWFIKNRVVGAVAHPVTLGPDWISLFIAACPQNFFFTDATLVPFSGIIKDVKIFLHFTQSYLLLTSLFFLNFFFHPKFRLNKKALAYSVAAFGLLGLCFIFTYLHPLRFFIDLNLTRNTQFLLFLLMGYTTIFVIERIEKEGALLALVVAILFTFLKYNDAIATFSSLLLWFIFFSKQCLTSHPKSIVTKFLVGAATIVSLPLIYGIIYYFNITMYSFTVRLNLAILFSLLLAYYFLYRYIPQRDTLFFKRIFILIPLSIFLFQYSSYHYQRLKKENEGMGFWQLQRSWEDMQKFVKQNTPINAMIFVPYNMEMGGFRIFSERKIVVCYRDCGIIGFDYNAAREWQKRVHDVEAFKYNIGSSPQKAIQNAIGKYKADYIVFVRYASPTKDTDLFERVYTNNDLVLFKIHRDIMFDRSF